MKQGARGGGRSRPPRSPVPSAPPPFRPAPDDGSGRTRVGFAGQTWYEHGGTESWHATLLPRLAALGVAAVGYAVQVAHRPAAGLGCPIGVGADAIRAVARSCGVLCCWGLKDLGDYLPPRGDPDRPAVLVVNHGDGSIPHFERLLRAAEPHADRYACVGRAGLSIVPEAHRARAVVIPNAVDPDRLAPKRPRAEVRAELGLADDDVMVLWPHRLSAEKRPALAAAAIVAAGPPFVLVAAGTGYTPMPESDRVRPVGRRDDVGDLYAAADLVLSTSESEGFGLSMAEALWCGAPLVGTPVGILADRPELARIVPVDASPEAWAEALRSEWADAASRRARSGAAARVARDLFGPDAFARRWAELFVSLAPPRARPGAPDPEMARAAAAILMIESCPHRTAVASCSRFGDCALNLGDYRARPGAPMGSRATRKQCERCILEHDLSYPAG